LSKQHHQTQWKAVFLPTKFARPLSPAHAQHEAAQRPPVLAVLHTGAQILPEAVIENLSGLRDSIVIGQNS
jgi:hypothetical protein